MRGIVDPFEQAAAAGGPHPRAHPCPGVDPSDCIANEASLIVGRLEGFVKAREGLWRVPRVALCSEPGDSVRCSISGSPETGIPDSDYPGSYPGNYHGYLPGDRGLPWV